MAAGAEVEAAAGAGVEVAVEVIDENRKRGAHEEGGDGEERKCGEGNCYQGAVESQTGDEVDEGEAG